MRSQFPRFLIFGFLVVGVILVFFFNPESVRYPPCFFKMVTGLQCPGCGSARASYHLLHGHFLTAIDYNLLFIAAIPPVAIDGVSGLFIRESSTIKFRVFNYIRSWQVMLVVMIFWIIRNLPVYPFILLSSDH
ncbi:MAG TPA: DUF2752 domain-containing protein [Flavitalea sp.]|nr:DUF2752 domain-containing protein [Flavitalea sp.]